MNWSWQKQRLWKPMRWHMISPRFVDFCCYAWSPRLRQWFDLLLGQNRKYPAVDMFMLSCQLRMGSRRDNVVIRYCRVVTWDDDDWWNTAIRSRQPADTPAPCHSYIQYTARPQCAIHLENWRHIIGLTVAHIRYYTRPPASWLLWIVMAGVTACGTISQCHLTALVSQSCVGGCTLLAKYSHFSCFSLLLLLLLLLLQLLFITPYIIR